MNSRQDTPQDNPVVKHSFDFEVLTEEKEIGLAQFIEKGYTLQSVEISDCGDVLLLRVSINFDSEAYREEELTECVNELKALDCVADVNEY